MQRGNARSTHVRRICLALLCGLLTSWACAAPVDSRTLKELDIPAQDLATALERFSRATGMAVLVDQQLAHGRRSVAVKGSLSAGNALDRLLAGSGLMARYARDDAFTLQVAQVREVPASKELTANGLPLNGSNYAAAIQAAIERELCRSTMTRPGSFRALLQLWIGRDGVIQHSRLVSSTGDIQRDAVLVNSLQNLDIDRPAPSSLRQPVTLLLLPESSGKRMECTQWEGVSGG